MNGEELKERPENLITMTAACRFCGQIGQVYGTRALPEEQVIEAVTEACSCMDAVRYRNRRKQQNKVRKVLDRYFRTDGEPALAGGEAQMQTLYEIGDLICMGHVQSAVVECDTGLKIKIRSTSKGAVRIEQSMTRKVGEEI